MAVVDPSQMVKEGVLKERITIAEFLLESGLNSSGRFG